MALMNLSVTQMQQAVRAMKSEGQRIFVREGDHTWKSMISVYTSNFHVTGDTNARLLGSWYLSERAVGFAL